MQCINMRATARGVAEEVVSGYSFKIQAWREEQRVEMRIAGDTEGKGDKDSERSILNMMKSFSSLLPFLV